MNSGTPPYRRISRKKLSRENCFISIHVMLSIKEALISLVMAEGWASFSLKTDSMTDNSVEVVSCPVKAHQSLTTMPAPITSAPLFTVPATRGTCSRELNSSWSVTEVLGDRRLGWSMIVLAWVRVMIHLGYCYVI